MAAARTPGPLGLLDTPTALDDGTLARVLSPLPGPVGLWDATAPGDGLGAQAVPLALRHPRRAAQAPALPLLRQGSRGPEVERLQRLVNLRSQPSPSLALDGVFGPVTQRAVLQFQAGVAVRADGVVGKDTWFHLLQASTATAVPAPARPAHPGPAAPVAAGRGQPPVIGGRPAPVPGVAPAPSAPTAPSPATGIGDWPLADKFAEALRRTAPLLPASMQQEFRALLSPASLGILAGTLVVWAGAHAFGVGEVVDLVLLAGGAVFLGMSVFDVAGELGDFLLLTSHATEGRDLDEAAAHLARAIAIVGVAAFVALLAKVARGRGAGGKGGQSGKGGATEPPSKGAAEPKPARAKPPAEPVPEKTRTEPVSTKPVKFGKRGLGTEPGAQPPTKAVLQEMAQAKARADLPPPAKPGWPEIDSGSAATFRHPPEAVELSPGDKLYRVIDSESNPNGAFWTTTDPRTMTEAQWRAGAAVKGEWNGDGAFVEYEVPQGGLKVWSGEAAPQMSSDGANVLRGGGNQVWMPPGSLTAGPPISTGY